MCPAPEGNKFALGNTGGRPPIFADVETLEVKCIEYFANCIEEKEKATVTGLALFLGFCDRSSLRDYAEKKEYSYIIKRAKLAVENSYENSGTTFDMFALKQMGWKDKIENVNVSYNAEVTKKEAKEISDALEDEC